MCDHTEKMKGIPFDTEMILAWKYGLKTETRRVIVPQPPEWVMNFGFTFFTPKGSISGRGIHPEHGPAEKFIRLKHQKGDHLWIREALVPGYADGELSVYYKADGELVRDDCFLSRPWEWKVNSLPARYCPRWAGRFEAEIIQIRVERVQEITEASAKKEGVDPRSLFGLSYEPGHQKLTDERYFPANQLISGYRGAYGLLWDRLNAKRGYSWWSNPCVFVYELRKIK